MAKTGKAKLIDLFVFEIESKKQIANLRGFHLRAIRLVKIILILRLNSHLMGPNYSLEVKMMITRSLSMIGQIVK